MDVLEFDCVIVREPVELTDTDEVVELEEV